jgi:DNA polymerase/3'-5' exonuclease PolX
MTLDWRTAIICERGKKPMEAPSSKQRVPLLWAKGWAEDLASVLRPACERIQIGGSIRRRKADVGDIELVMVPRFHEGPPESDLFGQGARRQVNELDELLGKLKAEGTLADRLDVNGRPAWGPKFKRALDRVNHEGTMFAADLFSVLPPAQWGVVYLLRTGPAEFNQRLVTQRWKGGLCPDDLCFRDGALYRMHPVGDPVERYVAPTELVPTPEEEDVFRALGLGWIAPMERQ